MTNQGMHGMSNFFFFVILITLKSLLGRKNTEGKIICKWILWKYEGGYGKWIQIAQEKAQVGFCSDGTGPSDSLTGNLF
jgi:hypothetical protein